MTEAPPGRGTYAALVLVVLVVSYGYFLPKLHNWGSNARMDLVYAVVDQGTVRIDAYHRNTGDKALFEGHWYLEKSIGPSLVGIPFYALFRALAVPAGLDPALLPDGGGHLPAYHAAALSFTTFFAVAVPSAILGAVVFCSADRLAARRSRALGVALAYGLGTLAFPYGHNLFQHQLSAVGAFGAFFLLWRVVEEGAGRGLLWGAGALLGLAVITEYPVAVIAAALLAWAAWRWPGRWALWRVVAGAAPFAAALAVYDLAAFGTVLPVGYLYAVNALEVHRQGFMGVGLPDPAVLGYWLTVSSFRGLFFLSPFLLAAIPGAFLWWHHRPHHRGTVVLIGGVVAAFFAYNAGFVVWWGGQSVGPRHLTPIVPFLALPVVFALERWGERPVARAAIWGAVALSILNVWAQTITGADFPPDHLPGGRRLLHPLTAWALPLLARGELGPNLGTLAGLPGPASLLPLAALYLFVAAWFRRRLSAAHQPSQPPPPGQGGLVEVGTVGQQVGDGQGQGGR